MNKSEDLVPKMQAHRGLSAQYPENTLAAFRGAVQKGYNIIELDPKFTSDGYCVILHDTTVNRTGRNPDGTPVPENTAIASLTLAEAQKLDFGLWFSPQFAGEKIPTLEEVLLFSEQTHILLKFDHVAESFTKKQRTAFWEQIKRYHLGSQIGFTCKSLEYLKSVIQNFPNADIHYDGPLEERILCMTVASLKNNRFFVWISFSEATEEKCLLIKKYGSLGIWALKSEKQLKTAVTFYHADVIETDGSIEYK